MVSAYDRAGMRAARQRIVLRALEVTRPHPEPDADDEADAPRTLRGEAVAAVLAATGTTQQPRGAPSRSTSTKGT
jgi:hypothetical protein